MALSTVLLLYGGIKNRRGLRVTVATADVRVVHFDLVLGADGVNLDATD
jgi:hypothetical protein